MSENGGVIRVQLAELERRCDPDLRSFSLYRFRLEIDVDTTSMVNGERVIAKLRGLIVEMNRPGYFDPVDEEEESARRRDFRLEEG